MTPREITDAYDRHANAGKWEAWCDLFAEDVVMDEQLAGHVEGLSTLRSMIGGMSGYSKFQNVPRHIIISGNEAGVISHISAANRAGVPIEADVANYFRFENDKIAYMANFHDSVPFKPFLEQ